MRTVFAANLRRDAAADLGFKGALFASIMLIRRPMMRVIPDLMMVEMLAAAKNVNTNFHILRSLMTSGMLRWLFVLFVKLKAS